MCAVAAPDESSGSDGCEDRVKGMSELKRAQGVVYRRDLCAVAAPDESSGSDGCVGR